MNEMQWMRMPIAAAVLLLAACGVEDVIEGGAHEPVAKIDVTDARRETMQGRDIDPDIVGPLMSPQTPGRLIYDEPVSLAEVAAADTLVRRENTGTTSAEPTRGAAAGRAAAPRDSGGSAASRPERR